jgi:ATP-dependent Clp protease ATP-binding subunit ClpX
VELIFDDESIDAIAEKAMKRKTGARGLRSIVESIMMEIMFDLPSIKGKKRVVVTKDVVEKSEKPELFILDKKKTA